MSGRDFLDLVDFDTATLRSILTDAAKRKAARRTWPKARNDADAPQADKLLAMIFERPSTRTRVSFDVAMRQLGGETTVLNSTELQLGRGETIEDTARVLSRYVDGIMIRARSHPDVLALAEKASVPVINGLTDHSHPCQIMGDILTYEEALGPIEESTVAWFGDAANNVAVSWIHAAVRFGFEFRLACPPQFAPSAELLNWAAQEGGKIRVTEKAEEAAAGASCLMTDTWVSMGDSDGADRLAKLKPFQVSEALFQVADAKAIFLHCLPAYRDQEMTAAVIDGPRSLVFDQAENRVHAQKGVLNWCLSNGA